jgi:hypothetical protein
VTEDGWQVGSKMGAVTAKSKPAGDAIVRRRRVAVASFRRDRRIVQGLDEDRCAPLVPDCGRIVFRSGRVTFR